MLGRVASFVLGLMAATTAASHDFWIEPAGFAPAPGQAIPVRLLVGERLVGEPVGRPAPGNMHRFVVADANGDASATLPGNTGADPAGYLRLARPGAYVVGFHGKPNPVELPAAKFSAYLADEGLDAVIATRAERGETDSPVKEIFSRCAKALIVAGPLPEGIQQADRTLGFPLELVAERAPWLLRAGDALPVRLLYEGRPLAGALVVARHRADPNNPVKVRSDAEGRALLPLPRDGAWMVKAVHMRPAPAGSGADWASLWASLAFSLGPAR